MTELTADKCEEHPGNNYTVLKRGQIFRREEDDLTLFSKNEMACTLCPIFPNFEVHSLKVLYKHNKNACNIITLKTQQRQKKIR